LTINPKPLTEEMVAISPISAKATGETITPDVVVTDDETLRPGTDYELSGETSAKSVGNHGITVTGKGNYTGAVQVTYTLTKPKSGSIKTIVKIGEDVPVSEASGLTNAVAKSLLTEQERSEVESGADATVTLAVNKAAVSKAKKKGMVQAVLKKAKVKKGVQTVSFFKVGLTKQVGDTAAQNMNNSAEQVTVTVKVPTSLPVPGNDKVRTYYLSRLRNGKASVIVSGKKRILQFKTNYFNTDHYALHYVDTQKPESPSDHLNSGLKATQPKKVIHVKWGKVKEADGYEVYVQYCGPDFPDKPAMTIHSAETTSVNIREINGKPLNLKKNYKIYVAAYRKSKGGNTELGRTIIVHIVGRKNPYFSNVKQIKLARNQFTLKKGKSAVIHATAILEHPGRRQLTRAHSAPFRYASTNSKVATVSKKGTIIAKGKGTCTVYVYAINGFARKVTVTVV
jgi:hypothetical protein